MPSSSTQADFVQAVFSGDPDMCVVVWIEKKVGVSINDSPERLEEARRKLDAGFGAKLMKVFRSKEANEMWGMQFMQDQKYTTLMLGAYMMHVGGKILPEDLEHLKACFEKFPGKNGYVFCMGDDAFRSAGKVQYGAALEHYIDGKPRSFLEPSCYNCGKIAGDLAGQQLRRCTRCVKHDKNSFYCSRDCQKENWKEHKAICCPRIMGMTGGHLGYLAMSSVV
ncbi:hypothetical protein LTR70_009961 [Exophiala xenobiotica]|uniref:MYND-type domain-containing protein n=1 Tax=Lithohypha guttulata TaxID=1690604 RepID=A0ABR0K088_9EURO|nr:hypothetical protein LTR24_008358 [Lithohypha guttulata]KAK5309817.1 hypothetical protein LTR70_009961 [Exophiala xenobiotica]